MKNILKHPVAPRALMACACISLCAAPAFANDKDKYHDKDKDSDQVSIKSMTSQQFAWGASVAGLKEVRLGEIADRRSSNADVKSFAQMMISDHGVNNQQLTKIAQSKGLSVPEPNIFDADHIAKRLTYSVTVETESIDVVPVPKTIKPVNSLPTITDDNLGQDYTITRAGTSTVQYRAKETKAVRAIQRLDALSCGGFDRAYADVMR